MTVLQKIRSFRFSKLMKRKLSLVVLLAAVPIASNVSAEGGLGSLNVTQEVSGLRGPWGFDFLPDGRIVVTEKRGRLYLVDKDGTKSGFNLALTRAISDAVDIPVIASGGVGNLQHLVDGVVEGKADAVLAASIFHFGEYTIPQAKAYMSEQGVEVRN